MKISRFRSLRARLLMLVAICIVPAYALFIVDAWRHTAEDIDAAGADLVSSAEKIALHAESEVQSTALFLAAVGRIPRVLSRDPAACAAVLQQLVARHRRYAILTVANPQGDIVCVNTGLTRPINAADREYFRRALVSREAVAGEPVWGRTSARAVLPVALALRDANDRVGAVLIATLDLAWFDQFEALALRSYGAQTVTWWNRDAVILYRNREPEKWAGRSGRDSGIGAVIAGSPGVRVAEATGLDGVVRVAGIAPIPSLAAFGVRISIAVPKDQLVAGPLRAFRRNAAVFTLFTVLAFGAAWFVGEMLIRRRVNRLIEASERFAAGDMTVRIGAPYLPDEIGRLSQILDQTAEALQQLTRGLEARVAERTAELALKNAELAQANEVKSTFLANMSHELRTPLNAIIGFSELLRDGLAGELNAQQKDFSSDILAAGQHLLALINDVLDLSKVEAGMMELAPEPVSMHDVFQSTQSMIREKALAHGIAIESSIDAALGEFSADIRKLKQIVFNLASNAVKFTPDGGRIAISAKKVARDDVRLAPGRAGRLLGPPESDAGWYCEISVSDTGIGIAEADLQRLFAPFSQIDGTLSRQTQGTGLGLSLVGKLARLHGGTVAVSSAPGAGSVFTVWLPIVAAEATPAAPAAAVESAQSGAASAQAAIAAVPKGAEAALALVVEDDDDAATIIEQQLHQLGFRTIRAATAEEGLVRAHKEQPALITLDIFLPGIDGWDFLQRAKADPRTAAIPVLIVSIATDLQHGLALGAGRVLQKPYTREQFREAIAGLGFEARGDAARRVLVVDDDAAAVELIAAHLAELDCRVLRAFGGREAIEAARRERPELIVLDLMMPEVSGFDVVEALRADPVTAAIAIVVVTGKDLTEAERRALNGHVLRIVEKAQLDSERFEAEVRRALRGGKPHLYRVA